MAQQRQQQTLTEVLAADSISQQKILVKLAEISGLLIEFQQAYPATYQYLCTQGQDATLGDAIQAIKGCVEIFN
ncbi:hypothetical protein [Nostoc sp. MS1]|uniref:hypothetical protein n=1 Tax=Nostoc sp. MS1 TaxID=2764711 RepID=UPI001CC56995|nr:hypothetical protein [Nostoc sp. MS1]BCL39753.1 hypothetical protein NSMS1_62000 [Nostoc sp. MS1]